VPVKGSIVEGSVVKWSSFTFASAA
jgi:hypothetical protein